MDKAIVLYVEKMPRYEDMGNMGMEKTHQDNR